MVDKTKWEIWHVVKFRRGYIISEHVAMDPIYMLY